VLTVCCFFAVSASAQQDFAASITNVVVVARDFPAGSVRELIALAKELIRVRGITLD